MTQVTLMLCVNDERGLWSGRLEGLQVEHAGDTCLRLECDVAPVEHVGAWVTVAGHTIEVGDYERHAGNVHWDCCAVSAPAACLLVEHLRRLGADAVQAWTGLMEAYDSGAKITEGVLLGEDNEGQGTH